MKLHLLLTRLNINLVFIAVISAMILSCGEDDDPGQQGPAITSLSISEGEVGTNVIIRGTNFGIDEAVVKVFFNDTEAVVSTVANDRIDTSVPVGATSGAIKITVNAQQANGPDFTVLAPITITVTDFAVTIDENPDVDAVLGNINVTTNRGSLSYTLTSQSKANALTINASTGELKVAVVNAFNYEVNEEITAVVSVANGEETATANITITIEDVQEVFAQDLNITVAENQPAGTLLGTIEASVTNGTKSFALVSESVASSLTLNSQGEVRVHNADNFDFETNPTLSAVVTVTNGEEERNINITITLTDVPEVVITASDFLLTIPENSVTSGNFIGSISATFSGSSNEGDRLVFMPIEESPSGAIQIQDNGNIFVADEYLFNYELYPVITATVEVSLQNTVTTVNVIITLTDVFETVQERLDDGETPFQIYNSDNALLGQIRGAVYGGGIVIDLNITTQVTLIMGDELPGTFTQSDAVSAANASTHNGFDDWRLPGASTDANLICRLQELNNNLLPVSTNSYWTSSNCGGTCFNYFYISNSGCGSGGTPSSNLNYVRPVRSFAESN